MWKKRDKNMISYTISKFKKKTYLSNEKNSYVFLQM